MSLDSDKHVLRKWIEREWHDSNAEYTYVLKYTYQMPPIGDELQGEIVVQDAATGDWEWAEKTAYHYGISMPEDKKS